MAPESCNKPSGAIFVSWYLFRREKVWYTENDNSEFMKSEALILLCGMMWNELGISGGTAIVILIALYFVIKWAVKNGMKEAYSAITGKKTDEDIKNEKELKELGADLKIKLS